MSTQETTTKTKGMCIATRCTSVEQFIQMFHRFVDEESFFVSTLNTRPPGLETSFSVQLADGTPVLRGLCVVLQAWTTPANPFKTPGVRLGIKRLTANSMVVFEQLLVTRNAKIPPQIPPPRQLASVVVAKPGTPKPLEKSAITETAPARSVPSRVVIDQPARPASEPIPQQVASESTDVIEEKTNVRETNPTTTPAKPIGPKPVIDLAKTLASIGAPPPKPADAPKPAPPPRPDPTKPLASLGSTKPATTPEPSRPPTDKPAVTALGTGKLATDKPADAPSVRASSTDLASPVPTTEPPADASRTPGSALVLPANPLMNLTDESLEGYVDCTLYEETGNFFPAEDDTSFVDDVVMPRGRRRSSNRFDSGPTTELGEPPRLDTAPDGALRRDSAPAIGTPPPGDDIAVARGSAPVLPVESTPPPASEEPATATAAPEAPKLPPSPPQFESPPQGVPAAVLTPTRRKLPPWWLLGGVGGLAVAVSVVIVVVMTSSSDGGPRTASGAVATKTVSDAAAPTSTPAVAQPATDIPSAGEGTEAGVAGEDDEEDDEPEGLPRTEGAPVVGSGPCRVVVSSTPAGSMVMLDGSKMGPSPITLAAECGKHKIEIDHPRYAAQAKQITLTEGKEETLDVTLARPTHVVTVKSNPPGAQVFINGRRAGTTPTKLKILGFVRLDLELKKTGYQPVSTKLYSKKAVDSLSVRLVKW